MNAAIFIPRDAIGQQSCIARKGRRAKDQPSLPCQIVRQSRKIIYRLLSWNPWQPALFRLIDSLSMPLRC